MIEITGIKELNEEVTRVLERFSRPDAIIRIWKSRHKRDNLSIELKVKIIQTYTDSEVSINLSKTTAT